jgi:hypothetical protein
VVQQPPGCRARPQGEQLTQALDYADAGNPRPSRRCSTLAKDGTPGNRAAAQLLQAGLAQEAGKADQAAKTFAAVAADSSAPQAYRDRHGARSGAEFRQAAAAAGDRPSEAAGRAGQCLVRQRGRTGGPGLSQAGHADLAGPLFAAIAKDKDVPDTIKRRARQVAGSLGVDAVDDVAAVVGQAQ